jgi:hypothetical protein
MSFRNPELGQFAPHEAEPKPELPIPVIKETLRECGELTQDPEVAGNVKEYLEQYFERAIKNSRVYASEKYGASFPYTAIRLSEVAQALQKNLPAGLEPNLETQKPEAAQTPEPEEKAGKSQEFIFGTYFSIPIGHQFQWVERGIDSIGKKLPQYLKALQRGGSPAEMEIYNMGNPNSELGSVSEKFLQEAKDKPHEHVAELYAEFISQLEKSQNPGEKVGNVRLWGVSMGATMAAEVGSKLLKDKVVSQTPGKPEERERPNLQVVMSLPVAASEAKFKKWQIPLGLGAEFAYEYLAREYGRHVSGAEGDFAKYISARMEEQGIRPNMSEAEQKAKKSLTSAMVGELREGIEVPEGLKTDQIVGMYDPLMYQREFSRSAKRHKERAKGSLGESMMSVPDSSHRQFAVKSAHNPEVTRKNYFERLVHLGEEIKNLKNS